MENQNPIPNPVVQETPPSQVYTAPRIDNPPPKKSFLSSRIVLLVVILLILFGAGGIYLTLNSKPKPQPIVPQVTPTPSPTPIDETANWKTYSSKNNYYSFKYPPNWFKGDESGEGSEGGAYLSVRFSPYQYLSGGFQSNLDTKTDFTEVVFYISWVKDGTQPDYDFIKSIDVSSSKSRKEGNETITYTRQADTKVAGYDAMKYSRMETFQRHDGSSKERNDITAVFKKNEPSYVGYYYMSVKFYPEQTSLENEGILNNVLSTFRFTETSPTPTCRPRPVCLDATPRCLIPETSDMCPKAVACTQDAKLCPDGKTYVGRQGPNCEFAKCPSE